MKSIQSMNTFCLSGHGYLEQVRVEKQRGIVMRIKALTHADPTDQVLLDCEVNSAWLPQIFAIQHLLEARHTIMLHFSCVYTGFAYCYPALTQDDPANMVKLEARLVTVEAWYCNGRLMPGSAVLTSQSAA